MQWESVLVKIYAQNYFIMLAGLAIVIEAYEEK
jgi:hypothetical protein